MEHAFRINSSVGCWMIVSLLVVTTNIAVPNTEASDEDGTAAHGGTRRPPPAVNQINIRQKL